MKRIVRFYVRYVQKILITILLTILYFTVFSITKLFMSLVPGKKTTTINNNSYWQTAANYNSDMESAFEQS